MSLASQCHRSRLARAQPGGCGAWDQGFAFAAVLPLRNRPVVLRLHLTDSSRRPGRCIAHAIVPLADLMAAEDEGARAVRAILWQCAPFALHNPGKHV